jgi:sigma-B regulation protein RsbU (phosphoserine phosphatase)
LSFPLPSFLLYTDGATEATDPQNRMYGLERLKAAWRLKKNQPPDAALRHILGDIRAFSGSRPLQDDLTLLALQANKVKT